MGQDVGTLAARAMQRETRLPDALSCVVIMPYLQLSMNLLRSSTLSTTATSSSLLADLYGSAGFDPVDVLEND